MRAEIFYFLAIIWGAAVGLGIARYVIYPIISTKKRNKKEEKK